MAAQNVIVPCENPSDGARSKYFGVLVLRQCWRLSVRGWALIGASSTLFIIGGFVGAYPFLASNRAVRTDCLVVEGWVHDYSIQRAAEALKNGSYREVFVTGGPVEGSGGYTSDYNTAASVGASRLRAAGVDPSKVHAVPSRISGRDRTYNSAIALRDWLAEHEPGVNSFNVLTEGAHARRSRLLFSKAFGNSTQIGIIPIDSPDYDARRWWRYSEGVREMIGETIAYVYARVIFSAPRNAAGMTVAAVAD